MGHSRAKILAGNSYALGRGSVTNLGLAYYWFNQAAKKDEDADGKRSAEAVMRLLTAKYPGIDYNILDEDDIHLYEQEFATMVQRLGNQQE